MSTGSPTTTVGVDMATDPGRTAATVIEWFPGGARITRVVTPCRDVDILGLAALGTVGVDCALGWPDPFVEFLGAVRVGSDPVVDDLDGPAWRERLSMRTTDLHVRRVTGRRPLSVATDLLGLVAIRTVSILARLRAAGYDVARDGTGRVIEVYPAAALRIWGIDGRGYKRDNRARERMVGELSDRMPWLDWGGADERAARSDHVLDSVVCALITRASDLGHVCRPATEQRAAAVAEGWIALPQCAPEDLLSGARHD